MSFTDFKLAKHKLDLLNDLVHKSRKPKVALKDLEKWAKRDPNNLDLQARSEHSISWHTLTG